MHILLVLMWKHLKVRKSRYISTAFEILSPCVCFLVIYSLRDLIMEQAPAAGKTGRYRAMLHPTMRNNESMPLKQIDWAPLLVLYTPDSVVANALMSEAGPRLFLKKLTEMPDHDSMGYYGFSRSALANISKFAEKMRDSTAIVIFQEMEGSLWPLRLNYTIRMKLEYNVHIYHALDDDIWPHGNFGAMYEPFMQLQWAIDSAYLKLLTGNEIYKQVELKQFPLADKVTKPWVVAVTAAVTEACVYGLLFPYIFFMSRLIEERSSGIQELVRMAGGHPNMILASHFLNMIPSATIYMFSGILFLKLLKPYLIPESNALLLMTGLGLDFGAMLARGLACSFIIKTSQYAIILSLSSYMIFYFIYRLVNNLISEFKLEFGVPLRFTGILPHVPVLWFWMEVGEIEKHGAGLSFSNMFKSFDKNGPSAFFSLSSLITQIIIFLFIAKVLSVVRPGKFGVKQPLMSVFKDFKLSKKQKKPRELRILREDDEEAPQDPRYFEEPPSSAEVGIRVQKVTKIYGVNRVLNNISFDVYRGEITVLLGHNGAGKTTLMSIITGMINVTFGKVFVNGYDIVKDQASLRRQVGFCTQDNIFYPDLTVAEHVRFFSMLRGKSKMQSLDDTNELLVQLGIQPKAKSKSSTLSGGMKRRLQLAMALAGEANVLILDEPTSGLDVETRRELWDLLLLLRGSRTVVLSTHFMEEADALGDRVIAIHSGTIRCHATPMFLKKSVGTGYRLNLTTVGRPKDDLITPVITKVIPDAILKEKTYNSLSYNLPASDTDKFPKLFSKLEENKSALKIDTIGVGVSTLEDVFLKLCSDVTTSFGEDKMDEKEISKRDLKKITGFKLYLRQFRVLFWRQIKFIKHNKIYILIMQILIPLLCIYLVAYLMLMTPEMSTSINQAETMNLDVHRNNIDRRVLYDFDSAWVVPLQEVYSDVLFRRRGDVVRRTEKEGNLKDPQYLFELDMNETSATIYFKSSVRHAVPIAMNMLSNVLASHYLGSGDGQSITTVSHPLDGIPLARTEGKLYFGLELLKAVMFTTITTFVIQQSALEGTSLAIKERKSGTRHIHVMSGCPPAVVWGAALLAQAGFYCCFLVFPALPSVFFDTNNYTFTQSSFIVTFAWLLVQGVFTFLPFCYVVGWFNSESSANILISVFCLIALALVHVGYITEILKIDIDGLRMLLPLFLYTFPPYTAMAAMYQATFVARNNAYCNLNRWMCPNMYPHPLYFGFDGAKCCAGKNDCNFCLSDVAPGNQMLIMFFQFLFYMTLTLIAQYGILNALVSKIKKYNPNPRKFYDKAVEEEKTYVSELIKKPTIPEALLVNDLHKQYPRCMQCKGPFKAVNGVSWSVQKGECFGLLGVNGAGKSTTFKMISGEETPTRGQLFSSGHHLKYPREKYLKTLGYCPQFFGLDYFLTGRDNLELLQTLRGLDDVGMVSETKNWISVVGLEKYTNIKVEGYSGGCTRRLGTAAALGSAAPLVLLDEPTSGVDVSARRRVWVAMRRGLKQRQGIVITSHSMDEMEALCDRIAIMSGGEIGALGSPAMLRAQHASGHALVLKLTPDKYEDMKAANVAIQTLKETIEGRFNCTLKDEHMTMLHYHINETMRYSVLFTALEELKRSFPNLVEDYSVTETTLEEVFLSFAQTPEKTKQSVSSSNSSPTTPTTPSTPTTSRSSPSTP